MKKVRQAVMVMDSMALMMLETAVVWGTAYGMYLTTGSFYAAMTVGTLTAVLVAWLIHQM